MTRVSEAGVVAPDMIELEARLRRGEALVGMGHFAVDADGGHPSWSDGHNVICGFAPHECPSFADVMSRIHPVDAARVRAAFEQAGRDGVSFTIEFRLVRPDGLTVSLRSLVEPAPDSLSGQIRLAGTTVDVSAQRQAEVAIEAGDERLRQAVRLGRLGIFDHDHVTGVVYWSAEQRAILGRGPTDPTPVEETLQYVHPDDRERVRAAMERAHDPGSDGTFDVEHRVLTSDGGVRWIHARAQTSFVGEGVVRRAVRTVGATADITDLKRVEIDLRVKDDALTERKRAEAQVRRSEAILRSVFEASKDAIVVTKGQRILFGNKASAEMYGYDSAAQLEGLTLQSRVPPSELARVVAINKAREEGRQAPTSYETRGLRRDGSEFDVEISASSYTIDGQAYPLVVIRDVSARKAAERALGESAERLSKVFNSTSDAQLLYRVTEGGRLLIVSANQAYKSVRQAAFPDAPAGVECRYREDMLADQGLSAEQIEREMPAFRQVIATGQAVAHEIEIPLPDGDVSIVEARIEPVLDPDGRCTHVLWVGRDITERKRAEAERERLERQLEQVRKMESIGQLAGGIAHDFNNMLTVVLGNIDLMKLQMGADHPLEEGVAAVEQAALRSKEMARQLLAFSRQQIIAPMVLDLNTQVASTRTLFATLIGEHVTVELRGGDSLWPVLCDPSQLDQILLNLVVNARDAMPRGGVITVVTGNVTLDATTSQLITGACAGSYVKLAVADEGVGIDPRILPRIFEPFFTTKRVNQGTGLGLATVYGIVKQNGWFIGVDSELGRGTTFTIYMPRATGDTAAPRAAGRASVSPSTATMAPGSRAATILLVEDDDMVRNLTTGLLNSLGYSVLVSDSPSAALLRLAAGEPKPDLLLTDVVMPTMSGPELRERIAERIPGIKTVLMSGYTSHAAVQQALADGAVRFIQKPFTKHELDRAIQDLLNAR